MTRVPSKLLPPMALSPRIAAPPSLVVRAASEPAIGSSAAPPTTLREILGRAYMLRGAIVWTHDACEVLGLAARNEPGGVDVRDVGELTAITKNGTATTVGAFASASSLAAVLANDATASATLAMVRLRLAISGARLTVVRDGVLATIPIDAYKPQSPLLLVSIEIPELAHGIGIAERRRRTTDGTASYELSVITALRISQMHFFEDVRIFISLDGVVTRATDAEAVLDSQRFGLSALAKTACVSAHAIVSKDARTSAAARAVAPLVLAALRESVAIAKPKEEEPKRRLFGAFKSARRS